ncbi:MAG: glycoside hydrolase family 65 protein [Anaerolineae bacterium]|nr:glycoside hydrolase family 65 protein [Anaerolineae bacterium]
MTSENWWLDQPEPSDVAALKGWEGLFTQGSGYLHVRGSLEEHLSDAPQDQSYMRRPANVTAEQFPDMRSKWGTFVPGIYGNHPLMGKEMANLPCFLQIALSVDDERLDIRQSALLHHQRALNLKTAVLARSLTWHAQSGAHIDVTFERFASAAQPHLFVQRLTLTSDRDAHLMLETGIDAGVRTSGYDHFAHVRFERIGAARLRCAVVLDTGDEVHEISQARLQDAAWDYVAGERAAHLCVEIPLSAGQSITFEKVTLVTTNMDEGELILSDFDALDTPFDVLQAEHEAIWQRRWEHADVRISGDDRSQIALRAALYHLLRAHPGHESVAIDPKAYAGDAYRGLYFWDTEMYLLPFFLYTDPERARMLTDFRIRTLSGARRNAAEFGYAGARYPWEGDADGIEQCPNWQYRDHEVHVTADVVYGLAHTAQATAQPGYLARAGHAVLHETAAYWLERIDWRPGDDYPSLLGVMGPDEYAPITNNNAYTNRMVAFALSLAATAEEDDGLRERCQLIARKLPLPRRADGLLLQCEEFEQFAEIDFTALWRDRTKPFAAQVSQERLYRSRCLKQADVLLLMMLFPDEFSDAEVRQAWAYYLPYTTHDSSLSPGVHALIALRLGFADQAWEFWERSLHLDFDGGAEEGIHIAAQGMNWQIAVFGFGGLRTAMQADVLTLNPHLPHQWTQLAFPVVWKGQEVYVEITPDGVSIENRSERDLTAAIHGTSVVIAPGNRSIWPEQAHT